MGTVAAVRLAALLRIARTGGVSDADVGAFVLAHAGELAHELGVDADALRAFVDGDLALDQLEHVMAEASERSHGQRDVFKEATASSAARQLLASCELGSDGVGLDPAVLAQVAATRRRFIAFRTAPAERLCFPTRRVRAVLRELQRAIAVRAVLHRDALAFVYTTRDGRGRLSLCPERGASDDLFEVDLVREPRPAPVPRAPRAEPRRGLLETVLDTFMRAALGPPSTTSTPRRTR